MPSYLWPRWFLIMSIDVPARRPAAVCICRVELIISVQYVQCQFRKCEYLCQVHKVRMESSLNLCQRSSDALIGYWFCSRKWEGRSLAFCDLSNTIHRSIFSYEGNEEALSGYMFLIICPKSSTKQKAHAVVHFTGYYCSHFCAERLIIYRNNFIILLYISINYNIIGNICTVYRRS